MLEFRRMTLFTFLLSCVKDEDISAEKLICDENVTKSELAQLPKDIYKGDATENVRQNHIGLVVCSSTNWTIKRGVVLEEFNFKYTMNCDNSYILPLGGLDQWSCFTDFPESNTSINTSVREDDSDMKYGAYECVEKMWPETIYLERVVLIHNTTVCNSDKDEHLKEFEGNLLKQEILFIDEVKFTLEFFSNKTECYSQFNNSNVFVEWVTELTFHLVHVTKYESIPDSVLNKANCELEKRIREILSGIMFKGRQVSYKFMKYNTKFFLGPCKEGSMVEKEYRSGFINEVPLCRKCQRGYYLNVEKGSCFKCEQYRYSDQQGATTCKFCFNVHEVPLRENWDSILDCYKEINKDSKWAAINRGFLFIIIYHLCFFAVVVWNIRWSLRLKLSKSASTEENLSTLV